MKSFEEYINSGDVKKTIIDRNLAKNLFDQSMRRFVYVENEEINDDNRDFILEHYYEATRTMTDALLALNGYKSYSHEATISFLGKDKDFSHALVENFDRIRRLRNGLRYYGKRVSIIDARESREISKQIILKLKNKLGFKETTSK